MQIYANKVFNNPIETIEIFDPQKVQSALNRIESLQRQGYHLLGYMRYDLKNVSADAPLIYFEAFDSFQPFEEKIPNYKIGTIVKPRKNPQLQNRHHRKTAPIQRRIHTKDWLHQRANQERNYIRSQLHIPFNAQNKRK